MDDDLEDSRHPSRHEGYEGGSYPSHHHHHSTHGTDGRHSSRSHHHHHHESFDFESASSPGEPRNGAFFLVPVLLVLLALGPLLYFQYDKGVKLERENDLLRAEVVRLSTELSTMKARPEETLAEEGTLPRLEETPPVKAPARGPEKGLRAKPVREDAHAEAPRGATAQPPPAASPSSMAPEESAALLGELALAPDGTFLTDEHGSPERLADGCAPALETAFLALSRGAREDAAITLESLVESKPLWPYGHFYLAVATGGERSFRQTQRLLLEAKVHQAVPPEGELYLLLASLFLRDPVTAKEALARLEASETDYAKLPLGPLYAPKDAPADLLERLRALSAHGLPQVVLLEVRKTPR